MDENGCPADYDELVSHYFTYVGSVCRRVGLDDNDLDDDVQQIFLHFFRRGFLEKYDPTMIVQTPSGPKNPRFKSLLRGFAYKYALDLRDRQQRRAHFEPLWCDEPLGSGDEPKTWLEVKGAPIELESAPFEMNEEIERARRHLATVQVNEYNLGQVFDHMLAEFEETGAIHRGRLAERLGVVIKSGPSAGKLSKSTTSALVHRVKAELAEIGFATDWS
jgi:DNA-directed RNA polymerase specialized sigma24 family protein